MRATGKTVVGISAISGYARTCCTTLLRRLAGQPERLESLSRPGASGGKPAHPVAAG